MSGGESNLPASVAARLLNRARQTGDADAIRIEATSAEDEYAGTRATLPARCGKARLSLQIDIGLGHSVWPAPRSCTYPALLDFPPPEVLATPREAVVAEKLEAMVVLGDRNSRIKEVFDLHHLASRFEFDRAILAETVRRTFARRRTPIPVEPPIGLTPAYWENPSRPAQVRAFAMHREWPVRRRLDEGSELVGSTDLVLEDDDGFVLVDHKCLAGTLEEAVDTAAGYGGQLAAYADAIEAATGKRVRERVVHLVLQGAVVVGITALAEGAPRDELRALRT